jgi:DNA-binding response OmpR family regulator
MLLDINNTYPNALHKEDLEEPKANELADSEDVDEEDSQVKLLVVEDNDDIRQYIADSFEDDYRILQATNGEEGLSLALEQMPDIIVSDIMMPRMNGIELTRQLKEDIRTSHIPIILLTAKDTDEDKEEGYDSGADSYLTKPFTAKLLGSRIRNLLTSRRRLAEQLPNLLQPLPTIEASSDTSNDTSLLSNLDREFLNRLNQLIDDNIKKEEIDLAFVTDKMAMSHSTFYRKVKALTGLTAQAYIRKRRLRYSYQLLASGDYNVSQAAMMTGFNQMAHFRETFKKEFGILPSEVRKNK